MESVLYILKAERLSPIFDYFKDYKIISEEKGILSCEVEEDKVTIDLPNSKVSMNSQSTLTGLVKRLLDSSENFVDFKIIRYKLGEKL